MNRASASPYLSMLLGSFSFAGMATLAHALGEAGCDWRVIALARTGLVLAFAALLARAAGVRLVLWLPATLWVRSVAGSLSLVGTFYAFTRLPVSDVLTLTNMFPVWVALLSWPLLGERPGGGVWLAVVSGVLGVALIQQPHFAEGNLACLIALGSSLFTAVAMIGLHRLHYLDVRAVVVHFSAVGFLFCAAALFLFGPTVPLANAFNARSLLMLAGVGVTATLGQVLLTRAFAAGAPAKVSVVGLTQIVFALGFDLLLSHRPPPPLTLLGMSLVVAPTAWLMAYRV